MNRIFRIVWNKTIGQLVVVSENSRSAGKGGRSAAGGSVASALLKRAALGTAIAICGVPFASAHTISVGYTNSGSGNLTFWYGTYHDPSEASTFEGQFKLMGPNGYEELVNFSEYATSQPTGLEDGVNNFYAAASTGTTLTPTNQTGNGPVRTWEGVSFAGLVPGTYTYMYVPIANPSQAWSPWAPVLSNTLIITGADLNGFPMENGQTYTELDPQLNDPNSILFNDGIFKPTTDVTKGQDVTVRSGGGTVDTTNGDVTFTGGVDGNGTLTKTGEGTLVLTGPSTYTGGTVVNEGTLQGDTTSLQGQITNDGTVAFVQPTDGTFDGTISGTGDVVKDGSGKLTIDQANTYTGTTSIDDGTLALDGNGSIGTGAIVVSGGGTLDTTDANHATTGTGLAGTGHVELGANDLNLTDSSQSFGGTISGTSGLNVTGGTQALTGSSTYSGGTSVSNGATVSITNGVALGTGDVSLNDGTLNVANSITLDNNIDVTGQGTMDVNAGRGLTNVGTVSGTGDFIKSGDGLMTQDGVLSQAGKTIVNGGTLVLDATNTYTGGTVLNGGLLQIANDGNLGDASSDLTLNGGTLLTTGAIDTSRDVHLGNAGGTIATLGDPLTFENTIDGAGKLNVEQGTVVLKGNNSYDGGTIIGGTVQIADDSNLGAASGGITLDGGTLVTTGNIQSARDITVTANNGELDTQANTAFATSGGVSGDGTIIKNGAGSAQIDGNANQLGGVTVNQGTLVLNGDNGYLGTTIVNSGSTLQVNSEKALGSTSGNGLILSNGTLATTGDVDTQKSIFINTSATLDVGTGTTMTSGGTIAGAGALVKSGSGTLVLDHANQYAGDTYIENGTLQIANDANLGSGANVIFDGGLLHTTGNVESSRNLVANNGNAFVASDAGTHMTTTGTVTGNGALAQVGPGTLEVGGIVSNTGGVGVLDGTLVLTGNNTYTGGTHIYNGTVQVASDANLGNAAGGIDINSGTLHTTASFDTARDITLGGTGTFHTDAGTKLTATGTVSGISGLVKNGEGTLEIDGVASHSGGTTVNDGTLILGGNNTYTGGNVINGGTLQVSSDANLGAAANNVAINGGNLTVTQTMTTDRELIIGSKGASITTLSGVTLNQQGDMSGTGGLVKLGGGTLVVSGNNSFTGGTLIQGGVIRIDSGSSLGTGQILLKGGMLQTVATLGTGQQVIISGNSGVNVDTGTTTVLSGNLTAAAGDACFVKSGEGKLSLTGSANLGSGTCVQGGILSANGNLTSSYVQVDTAGTLRGTGLINGPVNVTGRLAAGNSPGTLTVAGTVTMQAGATLQVDIDGQGTGNGAGNYSRVLVTGAGNQFIANGTLAPTLRGITGDASNTYTAAMGTTYRIVEAEGGVTGQFTSITQPTAGLAANTRFLAFYGVEGGHAIDLRVTPVSYAQLLGASAKRNGLAAAGALDGAVLAQDANTATAAQSTLLYAVSSLGADQVGTLVKSLSGEVHADEAAAARNAGLGMQRDVADHLGTDVESADAAHRVWANLTRDGNRSIADGQGSGFETGTDRSIVGIDLYAENGTVLGVAGTHHDTNVIAQGGSGSIRGNSGIVYAQQSLGGFVLDGMAARGTTDWTTRRADPMGGSQLESHTSGKDTMASATLRMPMQTAGGNRIEPYVTAVWQKVERDASAERGTSVAALSLDKLSETGTRVLAGVTLGSKAADPLASTLTWRAGVAVGADSGNLLDPTVHNTLAGQRFDTAAPGVGRGFVQLSANGTMRLAKSTYLYGGITAEDGARRSAYGVTAGVRVAF
ncbi:MAG TPA: autotransporter-associated beta strand repeat-containing protein [Luteibacter sp.]|jgi:autotransporter-associated beta strand protein